MANIMTSLDQTSVNMLLADISKYGLLIDSSKLPDKLTERQRSECERYLTQLDSSSILHPMFSYPGTVTNRITSHSPNIIGMSKDLRSIVIPRPDCVLIDADYHQADIGGAAWLSADEIMQKAYASGTDFHKITAARIFGIPIDKVNAEQRQQAKKVSLGILYGQTAYGIANELNITKEEAQQMIDCFFYEYNRLGIFKESIIKEAFYSPMGVVTTLFGTPIPVAGIHSWDAPTRRQAYRQCLNYAVQGTTSDVFLRAFVQLHKTLKTYNAHILVLAYDEFLVEAPVSCVDILPNVIEQIMLDAAQPIKMSVDVQIGNSWAEVH